MSVALAWWGRSAVLYRHQIMNWGEQLKQWRIENGVALRELARRLDVSHTTVIGYERSDNLGEGVVRRYCAALGCDVTLMLQPSAGG